MENKIVKVTISGKDYPLRYTLKAWKDLKNVADMTISNVEEKINEDPQNLIHAVWYGIPENERTKLTLETLENDLELSVMEKVEKAMLNSMPEEARKTAERMKKEITSIVEEESKKLLKKETKK